MILLTAEAMSPDYPQQIAAGLRTIRRRRRAAWIVFFLFLPATGLADLSFRWVHSRFIALGILLVWIGVYALAGHRLVFTRCPRCGELFHSRRDWRGPMGMFTRACLHCGLRLR